jgi:hypothetical protein
MMEKVQMLLQKLDTTVAGLFRNTTGQTSVGLAYIIL